MILDTRPPAFPFVLAAICLLSIALPTLPEPIKEASDSYFAVLKKDFDRLATLPFIKNPRTGPANGVFVSALKKHQTVSYLARVNSKGIVVNEVIRGEVPDRKVHRKLGDAEWYSFVVKNHKPYCGFTEDNGRYYLVWSDAVVLKKRVAFVIGSRIDIWDCFRKLSNETQQAFLVRIGAKSLYSNKWKTESSFLAEQLEVPGADNITLLTEKAPVAAKVAETLATSVTRDTSASGPSGQSVSGITQNSASAIAANKAHPSKHRTLFIVLAIVAVLLLAFLVFRFYVWLNHQFLMRSINKPD
jgi:hypothetical protein